MLPGFDPNQYLRDEGWLPITFMDAPRKGGEWRQEPVELMNNQATTAPSSGEGWEPRQVYVMAAVCLVVGLALGYLFRGSQSPAARVTATGATSPVPAGGMGGQMPTLNQMKHMADVKAQPLLDKLKTDPANSDLLIQVATVYRSAHQFKEAAEYYDKSLRINPKNVLIRTEMASCLYYDGNVDGALAQLEQSLKDDPKNANALFNLGMIRLDAKKDPKGAVSAWQELLKLNPALEADRKAAVEKMIAEARAGNKS